MAELRSLLHQRVKRHQFVGALVHAHQRHQRTALPSLKTLALRRRRVVRQFNPGKHKQQPLRHGLGTRGLQEIVKTRNVHESFQC